jgi:4-hydroxybenzoate polyprenyltransferase
MSTEGVERKVGAGSTAMWIKGMLDSARISTRLWFDLLAPAAMMLVAAHREIDTWPFAGVLVIAVLFHAAANYFNDLADTAVDIESTEENRHQRALVSARVSRRDLQVAAWGMVGVTLVIAAFLPWPSFAILTAVLLLAVAYDFEPLHLSNRPLVLQVFWPVIWGLIYALCAVAMGADGWRDGLPFVIWIAVFMGLGEGITQDVRDADNDRAGGRRTTPVVFGVPATVTAAWLCQLASLAAWVWFVVTYPLPLVPAVIGGLAIAAWLVYFFGLVRRLRHSFEKAPARMTHVGPIYVFSIVNVCVIVGVLVR